MDIVFILGIAGLWLLTTGLAAGCARLGEVR